MSEVKIDRALEKAAVAALGSDFTGRIATEGDTFTPIAGQRWASLFNLRASADVASLGVNGMDEHTGVYQIDVNVPETTTGAKGVLLAYADAIKAIFIAGQKFDHLEQFARVRHADTSSIRRVDGWLRVSVSVTYSAFTIRPEIT